jgi:hypothetical protein
VSIDGLLSPNVCHQVRAAHEAMRVLLREGLIVAPSAARE